MVNVTVEVFGSAQITIVLLVVLSVVGPMIVCRTAGFASQNPIILKPEVRAVDVIVKILTTMVGTEQSAFLVFLVMLTLTANFANMQLQAHVMAVSGVVGFV
jgi:hypothetical protein